MIEIIPAILPKDYYDLKNKLALVRGLVPVVQIDICDGQFVRNTTWPFDGGDHDPHFKNILNENEGMPFWEDIDFELDLMVLDAVQNFDIYTKLGVRRIIFHIEAVGDVEEFKNFLEGMDLYVREAIEIGVAINIGTEIEKMLPIMQFIDFAQVMGIEQIGFQGADFDDRCIEHIKNLKERFPEIPVSVDGGVSVKTAQILRDAGADRLVAGSALFNTDDIIGRIEEFKNL